MVIICCVAANSISIPMRTVIRLVTKQCLELLKIVFTYYVCMYVLVVVLR